MVSYNHCLSVLFVMRRIVVLQYNYGCITSMHSSSHIHAQTLYRAQSDTIDYNSYYHNIFTLIKVVNVN